MKNKVDFAIKNVYNIISKVEKENKMKSITNNEPILTFPKLMITQRNTVVLFLEPKIGICISKKQGVNTASELFSLYNHWDMDQFKEFTGSVTVSN